MTATTSAGKTIDAANPPTSWLGTISAEARDQYKELRSTLLASGPLDATTCEIINVVALAIRGFEPSFRIHAARLAQGGVPKRTVQHALVSTLGATTVLFEVARALQWLDDVYSDPSLPPVRAVR